MMCDIQHGNGDEGLAAWRRRESQQPKNARVYVSHSLNIATTVAPSILLSSYDSHESSRSCTPQPRAATHKSSQRRNIYIMPQSGRHRTAWGRVYRLSTMSSVYAEASLSTIISRKRMPGTCARMLS